MDWRSNFPPPTQTFDFSGGAISPALTYSRASSATYYNNAGVITTVTNDTPRFDYNPATLTLNGLLMEGQASNIAVPSTNYLSNASPSGSVDGVTQNIGGAPDGTSSAMALINGTFSAVHQYFSGVSGAASTIYTHSVYCKAAGYNFVVVSLQGTAFGANAQSASFNLSNGTVDVASANGFQNIQSVGNGWYRCSVQATSLSSAGNYFPVVQPFPISGGGTGTSTTGDGVNGIWVWGRQVEVNLFASSYIPTVGTAVTRARDVLSTTALSWFNPTNGTLMSQWQYLGVGVTGTFAAITDFPGANSNTDTMGIRFQNATNNLNMTGFTTIAGTTTNVNGTGNTSKTSAIKSAWSYTTTVQQLSVGGAVTSSGSTGGSLPTVVTFQIAGPAIFQQQPYGWIVRVQYWNSTLSAAQLQTIST